MSSLSDVSITDDYCHKTSNTVLTSKDLNEIFLAPHETKISTPPTKQRMSDTIQEKTHALNAKAKCDEWLSPSKRPAMHLVLSSDEQSNASPLTGSSPIYEQVNDANCFSDIDNQEHNAGIVETTDESLYDIRFRSNVVDPQNCHHNFSHRTASRSEICFHCFKKYVESEIPFFPNFESLRLFSHFLDSVLEYWHLSVPIARFTCITTAKRN